MTGLVVTLCVLVIALCTAGAFAVRTASRIWLRHLLESQPVGAALAEHYLSRPQRLHASAGAATALAALTAGAFAARAGTTLSAALWLVGAFTAVCVLGVAVPRALARRFPTRVVPITLPVLHAADVLATPLRAVAERTVGAPSGPQAADTAPAPSATEARTELEDLLREGQLEGVGDQAEIEIITGVVQFGGKCASDVMTPRSEIFALDVTTPTHEMARAVAHSGYSRVPVYQGTLDNIAVLVLAFAVLRNAGETRPQVHAVFVAGTDVPCTELLARMLRARLHFAVVRDAAGAPVGVVTLDDLLEELVGDIRDEHDEPAPDAPAAGSPAAA